MWDFSNKLSRRDDCDRVRYLSRETDDKEHGAAEEDPVFHQQALHS